MLSVMLNGLLRRAQKEVQLLACIWVIHLPWKSAHHKSETSSYLGISYNTLALQHPHMGFLQPCHPPAFIQQGLTARFPRWVLCAMPKIFLQRLGMLLE